MIDYDFLNADVTGEIIASAVTNIVGDENDLILKAVSTEFYRKECMKYGDGEFMGDPYELTAQPLIDELGYAVEPAHLNYNENIQLKALFIDYYRRIYGDDIAEVVRLFKMYDVLQHIDDYIEIFGGEDPANGVLDIHTYITSRQSAVPSLS